ncbi:MAG: TolC family protein [Bacteroidia bacterium]|nr:MAG: TolC family protein [Bacteroidia bacterium]
MRKFLYLTALSSILHFSAPITAKAQLEMDFDAFFHHVLANNIELIIEQYEVTAAEAALLASRVFEDPELELIFPTFDKDEFSGFPSNIAFEMEIPVDIFGKRRNRVRQARAEKYAAQAGLENFLRYLRADAANTFIEAITLQLVLERKQLTLEQLNQLTELNLALYEAGEIGEIDVLQTRLEARNFEAELFDVQSDYSELMGDVYFLMGGIPTDSIIFKGNVSLSQPVVSYDELLKRAKENRPDIIMAQRYVEASRYAMREARADRFPDISLIAGYHNEHALSPSPGFRAAYGGLIIPLKFSGINPGAFRETRAYAEQADYLLDAAHLQLESEVKTAWKIFLLLSQKRMLFTESILEDAERVRDAISFSYQRGEVSLLEVLDAQRTMNEVYMNYYETLNDYARSVVNLSAVAGEWFVVFE